MNGFEVKRKDLGDVSCLYIKGFLDAHTAPVFEEELQKLVDEKRFKIVVNFKDLCYISSAGLGVFMGFIEDIRENKGDIKLTNMTPKVFKVFDLLGFPSLYEIYDNEEEAIKKYNLAE
ncbi:anti-sigma factor antagonist [candidate division KSB1 bacterium]|nr:MAG: anti-sigma factor antagonist [candidate division KSB1 bacterium]